MMDESNINQSIYITIPPYSFICFSRFVVASCYLLLYTRLLSPSVKHPHHASATLTQRFILTTSATSEVRFCCPPQHLLDQQSILIGRLKGSFWFDLYVYVYVYGLQDEPTAIFDRFFSLNDHIGLVSCVIAFKLERITIYI